ncbi:glutamate synthase (NADPH), homotetrameric, partial [Kipferlia bialata]
FDGHIVNWDSLGARMRSYYEIEQTTKKPQRKRNFGVRVPMPELPADFRAQNFMEVALGYTEELAQAEAARCLQCKKPKCRGSCPVSVDIPTFIRKVTEKDYHGALDVIKQNNACPGITGRVCPQEVQCESTCVLGEKGLNRGAIAIGRLERFVADYCRKNPKPEPTVTIAHSGCKVAVVGSGPAGIAAAAGLAQRGHRVTIFEALHTAGGVTAFGIPSFRLPKDLVQHEIDALTNVEGGQLIDIRLNTPIGPCGSVPELMANGYDAAFIGTGAGLPYFLNLPGEDIPGVYSANEYLTRITLMRSYEFPAKVDTPVLKAKSVVVIGGGNVACDVARCAKRLGADVTMVYRRPIAKMPARREEIHHAIQEGIKVKECFSPVEFIANCEGTGLKGVLCQKMDNSDPTKRPTPIPNSNELVSCGLAVIAVGQGPNPMLTKNWPELATSSRGLILVDDKGMSNIPGVFSGGDIVSGAATVINALGAGRKCAEGIDAWLKQEGKGSSSLRGLPVRGGLPIVGADKNTPTMTPLQLKIAQVKANHDAKRQHLSANAPVAVLPRVEAVTLPTVLKGPEPIAMEAPAPTATGLSMKEDVPDVVDVSSASIMLDTADCVSCGACVEACSSVMAMDVLEMGEEGYPVVGAKVKLADSDCIGCGACVRACPVNAIQGTPSMEAVLDAIESDKRAKVCLVAPSCKVGVYEVLYGVPGNGEKQTIAGLRNMGFDYVIDVQTGADMTIAEESKELLERVQTGRLPLLTSCCPSWTRMAETQYPELVPHLSSARSPQAMTAATARAYFAKTLGCRPSDIYIASLMPCTAKKSEIRRKQLEGDCDDVITVREFMAHLQAEEVSVEHANTEFDALSDGKSEHSGAATIFGTSGGVMEAALRSVALKLGGDWKGLDLQAIQGLDGIKEAEVSMKGHHLKVCVVSGGLNIRAALKAMKDKARYYDVIEVMACPGGCIGGGGMPQYADDEEVLAARMKVLRKIDEESAVRTSDNNSEMAVIYNDVIGDRAHELLHTTFDQ